MDDIIEGNEKDKLLYGEYVLVNASKKVIGGPFTRYEPSDPEDNDNKSVLSLCIVSAELYEYVDSLTIDKEKHITPYRTISKSKKTFTDHYTMIVNVNSEDSNYIMKKIDNELDKIRNQAFGKVKGKSKKTTITEIDVLQTEKDALLQTKCDDDLEEEEQIATTLLEKQRKRS